VSSRFWERYQAGEHVAVWKELIELDEGAFEEPIRSEAARVCEEIVRRARLNLRTLRDRLLGLVYEFAYPQAAVVEAGPGAAAEVERAERELGNFPLIARVWYGSIASVDFRQAESQRVFRQAVQPPPGPDVYGLGSHAVLVFQSLDRCREQLRAMAEEDELARDPDATPDPDGPAGFLPLGGWASNCDPKGFPLPCRGVDAVIYHDGGGDTYFVDELRAAFRWGGFPFWQGSLKNPSYFSPMEYRPNFAKLLPVLREGLLEL
jgi:hypothetical protein